jgi:hypothetical protein
MEIVHQGPQRRDGWNHWMKGVPFFVAVLLLSSGCASSDSGSGARNVEGGGTILVDEVGGGKVLVNMTNETGAVVGDVLNDAGFGLPGARVTVGGSDHGETTNATGHFQIENVRPGMRLVYVEHADYRSAEREVAVTAGKVQRLTITLVPTSNGDPGGRPHVHDYWAGRTEVTVIDSDFDAYAAGSGSGGTYRGAARRSYQLAQGLCVSGSNGQYPSSELSPFSFDDPNQLVWPGTGRLNLRISWSPTGYTGDQVGIVWRSADGGWFHWSPPVHSGEVFPIQSTAAGWDNAHQAFSMWEFYLCTAGNGTSTAAGITLGRTFTGKFHVRMDMVRDGPMLVDPAHPRFWQNGSTVRVLHAYKNITCPQSIGPCAGYAVYGRNAYLPDFRLTPTALIPPGTGQLDMFLRWSYTGSAPGSPLGLAYSPSNVRPGQKQDVANYIAASGSSGTAGNEARFAVQLQPTETDSFYQERTNWAFIWGEKGSETKDQFLFGCACTLRIEILVNATLASTRNG